MSRTPEELSAGLVAIARDFLEAHRRLSKVAELHRDGSLRFPDVRALVGDDEGAVLFRLKERSHALFRDRPHESVVGPDSLFDLAVGSLFHEAMKFRENFYQRDAYGPKVQALRESPVPEAAELLREFEKILEGARDRLDEALQEALILMAQTTNLFRALLRAHATDGFVTRFLVSRPAEVAAAFGSDLDELLADVHGSAREGFARAARSFASSGFFAEAARAYEALEARGGAGEARRLGAYARGMQAWLERRYDDALDELAVFADGEPAPEDADLRSLAGAALSRMPALVEADDPADLGGRAAALADRIAAA